MTPPAAACRNCGAPLATTFVNLGMSPLCESFVPPSRLQEPEPFYPLHVFVCDRCLLVQLLAYVSGEAIFSDYAYYSSYSDSYLTHAKRYVAMAIERFGLTPAHRVVEVGSNDGYLLRYVMEAGIQALGIEPAANVAQDAVARGIPTLVKFFGGETARALAADGVRADLMVANNVIAHVADLNDFVDGFARLLAPAGIWTIEIPHLLRLVEGTQYDTIYHEHYSYFSFHAMEDVLRRHGLEVFDVEEIWTHGGSLRYFVRHAGEDGRGGRLAVTPRVAEMREREREAGVTSLDWYAGFGDRVERSKWALLEFLIGVRREGKRVAGYGAPGKGNTLLNYCGIRTDLLEYTVDRNPHKHGMYLPGTRIPIHPPERIFETRPDYVLILPWNLAEEIVGQMHAVREWGGQFVVPIPLVRVLG